MQTEANTIDSDHHLSNGTRVRYQYCNTYIRSKSVRGYDAANNLKLYLLLGSSMFSRSSNFLSVTMICCVSSFNSYYNNALTFHEGW